MPAWQGPSADGVGSLALPRVIRIGASREEQEGNDCTGRTGVALTSLSHLEPNTKDDQLYIPVVKLELSWIIRQQQECFSPMPAEMTNHLSEGCTRIWCGRVSQSG